ncbi:MAG: sigma-70 family RNA polymerase sigma factor [Gemmatimonadetes bacterium]|uniref:Sigma-70 family RNA polymerase sigma factor n=1 Tax=Candidatus Kutchimonas denitrificans TaxID=3056748 RepID=A0AAE4ZD33_9BACT|nr:sigma-70 family RNA polymerase sigma factor [Gemmatimonadota bacterium]NIR75835.1 sigma-70 family RNA polymerase sigma factor [Candidatus Kutchimonas denitrificans]NIS02002.1 sigma-70 family RNA polymerase sigma factor [Gemmatimonadota bacterium]NIT67806.1 sigma-70 family RNA polymerase sigma factor [Gemmatimonadota bacterium]NIU53793.1 hypothetical protein [Gemmatimonadota bacterium]
MNLRTIDPISRSRNHTPVSPRDSAAPFPPTRLSILERIRSGVPEVRREAYGALAQGYWKPIYKYLRIKWKADVAEAEDLTQAFLATAYEKAFFERFEPEKARFRTFLRTCLDRFVMNERKAAGRLKRGGGLKFVALEFEDAEGELRQIQVEDPIDVETFFRQEMIRDLFARTLRQVRDDFDDRGKSAQFQLFERYDLEPSTELTYADLAEEFGLTVTQVTNHLAAVRRAFRDGALRNLQEISGTETEYRADAREIFGIEVR